MARLLALALVVIAPLATIFAWADPVPAPVTKLHDASAVLTELLARTDTVAKEVAKVRALPLKRPIPNEVIDKAELHDRLMKMAADGKTQAETAAEGLALARWGLIPSATDYEKLVIDVLNEQIAGYYDPKTKKLTISKSVGDDREWAELVLAHEIDHGLQDQSFDLKKFEDLPQSEGDAAMARHGGIALALRQILERLQVEGLVLQAVVDLVREHHLRPLRIVAGALRDR